MFHRVKDCLEDKTFDITILHHNTNDLESKNTDLNFLSQKQVPDLVESNDKPSKKGNEFTK